MRIPKFIIVLFLLAFLSGIGYIIYLKKSASQSSGPTTSTGEVMLGTLTDEITVNGTAELANEQKLRFGQNGKVTNILVKVGENVEKNAVLAILDKREFFQELAQMQNRIDKTYQSIAEEKDKAHGPEARRMEREIASMERKLEEAEEDFSKAVKNSPAKAEEKLLDLNAKKRDLQEKKDKYQFDKEAYEKEIAAKDTLIISKTEQAQKSLQNTIYTMDAELSDIRQVHNAINKIFSFDIGQLFDVDTSRGDYIGINSPSQRRNVEILWKEVQEDIRNFEKIIIGIDRNSKKLSEAQGIIEESLRVHKKLLEILDESRRSANATPIGYNYGLSSSELSAVISEISNLRSSTASKIASLNETRDSLLMMDSPEKIKEKVNAELNAKKFALESQFDALKKLEIQIRQEEDLLKITPDGLISDAALRREILDKQSALQDQKDALQSKKEEFAKLKSGKSEALQNLQSTLKDQLAEMEKLRTKEESYEIRAPFAGTIRAIKIKVGDILGKEGNDADKTILLENSDIINVKVEFNQLDIIKVKIGQEVDMSFDAVPDAILNGKITEISSTPKESHGGSAGLAMYEALVSAERKDYPIYSGMNARISLIVGDITEALLVPITAVSNDPKTGEPYVNIVENGTVKKVSVTTGKTANGQIEITSGLSEGQIFQMIDFNANTYSHTDFTDAY